LENGCITISLSPFSGRQVASEAEMLVTLFSDASICPDTGCVGWAAWARCDRGVIRADGTLKRLTIDSTAAEAMALVNGIVMAKQARILMPGDTILAQTDNNGVMDVLHGETKRGIRRALRNRNDLDPRMIQEEINRRNEEIREISKTYQNIIQKMGLRLIWRHCKGHRGVQDPRAAVNTYCDKASRIRMQGARTACKAGGLYLAA
jgi:hypothetical protein